MNKKEAFVQIIDVAVSADCNVTNKEAEEVDKYRDFSTELVSLSVKSFQLWLDA